jgi:hypothetical protein
MLVFLVRFDSCDTGLVVRPFAAVPTGSREFELSLGALELMRMGIAPPSWSDFLAASFATSAARSRAIPRPKTALARCSISRCGSAIKSSASGAPKLYSLHAPEVECIGKGKARAPYEFGCKVSIVTPVTAPKGGRFVLHSKALHGNPYDGHTLGPVIADLEKLTGVVVRRIHGDKGYRGHNYPDRFKSGSQARPAGSPKSSAVRCGVAPPSSL